jgi:glucose/arabinose dehydrogenase
MRLVRDVAVDGAGNLYIADEQNHRIRVVTPSGVISTLAGTGVGGFSGDNGPANQARISGPRGVAVDAAGRILIGDTANNRIRRVTLP